MQLVLVLHIQEICTLSPRDTSTLAKAAKAATPPGERGVHFRYLVAPRELVSLTSRESIN